MSSIYCSGRRAGGEVFGDAAVTAGMIDCLVHHAEVLSLKGDPDARGPQLQTSESQEGLRGFILTLTYSLQRSTGLAGHSSTSGYQIR